MNLACLEILVFSVMVGHCSVISINVSLSNYSDTCEYDKWNYPCGDVCIDDLHRHSCMCGDELISEVPIISITNRKYCCTHSTEKCRRTIFGATCQQGEVLVADHLYLVAPDFVVDDSPLCHGRCYNDYFTSQHLGMYTHYSCPDKCIYWSGLCRGVSFCEGDEEICGEDLRCPSKEVWGDSFVPVQKHLMPTNPVRSYCFGSDNNDNGIGTDFGNDHLFGGLAKNDGRYDNIDRSDEDISQSDEVGRPNINYTALEPCTEWSINNIHHKGLTCGNHCLGIKNFCLNSATAFCSNAGVLSSDPVLCSNHTFWQNFDCNLKIESFFGLKPSYYPGKRCSGKLQHCYYPLDRSLDYHPTPDTSLYPTTCGDKSDRVFNVGHSCPDETPKEKCTDWNFGSFPCPESPITICWESCDKPGPNCTACTNLTYFQCPLSKQCIHPSLQCDGHPQCESGEDEDLDICKERYQQNRVISKYATFRCKSIMYPTMETYATACNDFPECVDGEDEKLCTDDTALFIILPATMTFIALIYLTLKLGRYSYVSYKRGHEKVYSFQTGLPKDILRIYSENHGKVEDNERNNVLLLHIIFFKSKYEIRGICKKLYEFESRIHNYNKSEIFCCLHKNIDPLVMEKILDNQFPGFARKCTNLFEKLKVVRKCLGFFSHKSWFIVLKKLIARLIKIELEYLDILKDSLLAFSLYRIVGGYTAILEFPTNFSIIVVFSFSASVVIPIFFATLHLATHNPHMIFNIKPSKVKSRLERVMITCFCFLFSFLNPIFLVNAYESAKEKKRDMIQHLNAEIVDVKAIQNQWIVFMKIELGKCDIQDIFFTSSKTCQKSIV